MKKTLLLAASALVLATAVTNTADAKDGFYIAARGGVTSHNANAKDDSASSKALRNFDDVTMYSGALGYRYRYFRFEAEYVSREDYKESYEVFGLMASNEFESTSYMFNAYVDFMPNFVVSPYLSGGIGWTDLTFTNKTNNPETSDGNNFTWSVGGGLTVRLNKCLNLDAGYRYYDMGTLKSEYLKKTTINAHEYYGGLRFTF